MRCLVFAPAEQNVYSPLNEISSALREERHVTANMSLLTERKTRGWGRGYKHLAPPEQSDPVPAERPILLLRGRKILLLRSTEYEVPGFCSSGAKCL